MSHALITRDGTTDSLRGWAKRLGIKWPTLVSRLQRGWSIEAALTAPVKAKRYVPVQQMLTHDGQSMTIRGWAAKVGVSYWLLRHRLDAGWTVERALTTPVRLAG